MCTFALLATWGYSKYSGNLSEVGAGVDALATKIWDSGLQPTFNKARHREKTYFCFFYSDFQFLSYVSNGIK